MDASQIKEHMEVYGSDHVLVGLVDRLEGDDMIKLTKSDSADGVHHFVGIEDVDHVDKHVHLSRSAEEVMAEWDEDEPGLENDDVTRTEIEDNKELKQEEWIERRR